MTWQIFSEVTDQLYSLYSHRLADYTPRVRNIYDDTDGHGFLCVCGVSFGIGSPSPRTASRHHRHGESARCEQTSVLSVRCVVSDIRVHGDHSCGPGFHGGFFHGDIHSDRPCVLCVQCDVSEIDPLNVPLNVRSELLDAYVHIPQLDVPNFLCELSDIEFDDGQPEVL